MLTVKHLSTGYGETRVLRGVSFAAADASVTAVLGPSGAGKTTLAAAVAGVLPVTSGQIIFNGADITGTSPKERLQRGIAWVPAGLRLFTRLRVSENLQLASAAAPGAHFRRQLDLVLSLFPEVRPALPKPAGLLSAAEQRIVAIACAIMPAPRLLVVDQPSFALSGEQIQRLYRAISQLPRRERMAMLLLERLSYQPLKAASVVYGIDDGRITAERDALELLADRALQAEFLRMTAQSLPATGAP